MVFTEMFVWWGKEGRVRG